MSIIGHFWIWLRHFTRLCSDGIQGIWWRNEHPSLKFTPGTLQKSEMAILPLFGHGRTLGETAFEEYYDMYSTVFNLYDIIPSQTSARCPLTPSRQLPYTPGHHPDTPRHKHFERIGWHGKKRLYLSIMTQYICYNPHTPARHSKISPRYHPDMSLLYISESGNENWPESRVKEVVFAHRFWAFYNA